MLYPPRSLRIVAFATAVFGALTPGCAGPILQGVTDTFIAFETESNGVITNGPPATSNQFVNFADPDASGGMALLESFPSNPAFNETGTDGSTAKSFDVFTLNFITPGDYTFYYTLRTQQETLNLDMNAGNSFFYSSSFGSPVNARTEGSNAIGNNFNYTLYNEATPFTVAAPGAYTFTIGDREAGTTIDRFIFSSAAIADKAAFDSVPNSVPEPGSLALLTFALGGMATRRIRRS